MCKWFLLSYFLVLTCALTAQQIKTVEAEYIYYAPENLSVEKARRIALERAQIKAIADEFGTSISQTTHTKISNANGVSDDYFVSVGLSEVKGEWIETIDEPKFEYMFDQDELIVKVYVKGKARELIGAKVDCVAKLLRKGEEGRFESSEFKDGDQFFLSFQTPESGNIAVYLLDYEDQAFCLLPYLTQQDSHYSVQANKRYLFFDSSCGDEFTEEYYLTCSGDWEYNQLYVIFSPNKFSKALDQHTEEILPRSLTAKEFHNWLAKNRRRDKDMQVIRKGITIGKE